MIQFNLLPEVKREYIRTQRLERVIIFVSIVVALVCATATLLLLLFVDVGQRRHLANLDKDIQAKTKEITEVSDLDKVLTIQNQLKALPSLEANSPMLSRTFGYIQQVTPNKVTISKLSVNTTDTTLKIEGNADSLEPVNKFVDTLKFTKYKIVDGDEQKTAFSGIVLTSFSKTDKGMTYSIDLTYDAALFDISQDVSLVIPGIITTRSETERPNEIFKSSTEGAGATN